MELNDPKISSGVKQFLIGLVCVGCFIVGSWAGSELAKKKFHEKVQDSIQLNCFLYNKYSNGKFESGKIVYQITIKTDDEVKASSLNTTTPTK